MLRKWVVGLCAIFALCFAAAVSLAQEQPAEEKVELAWKFQKGQKLEYVQKSSNDISQSMPGMGEMNQGVTQEMGMIEEVTDIDDKGVATVQLKYSYVKVKQPNMMGGTTDFDSTDKEKLESAKKDPNLKPYVAMLDKPFFFRIDRKGTILEVKGFTEIIKEMLKDDPIAQEAMEGIFSDEALKKMFQLSYLLPKEKVGKGDSWTNTSELPMGMLGTLKTEQKFTFEGIEKLGERQCAKMKYEVTKFTFEGGLGGMLTISKPEGSGTYYFDIDNGILVKMEYKIGFTMTMEMPEQESAPPVKMTFNTTTSMTLKEPAKEEPKREETPAPAPK